MGSLGRVLIVLALVLTAVPPQAVRAANVTLDAFGGHWRCTAPGARPSTRSYFLVVPETGPRAGLHEIFGRADETEPDGTPSVSFEHIAENPDRGVMVEAVEGNGSVSAPATSAHFAGRSFDDKADFTLAYDIAGETLQRTATRDGKTVGDERCTREPQAPVSATCDHPNMPAAVVAAVEPDYPADAVPTKAHGVVNVRVVLDDRSRVLWTDIVKSDNALFDSESIRAARETTYRTAVRNCRPVAASYVFAVEFTGP